MKKQVRIALIAVVLLVAGCGYHVSGGKGSVASNFGHGIESVAVPIFKNQTLRAGVEGVITTALVDDLVNIVEIKPLGIAEATIEGVIKSYELSVKSYGDGDVVSEYRLKVVYSVRLVSSLDGTILWQDRNVSAYADFLVDIASVAITKEREAKALEEIARESARLVRERMAEPFVR
ncbi:MAG: hypothetical protein KAS88_01755 [Deltaproteobacteria bacterium]|nr:hypothetical protein [Deltaproteobacteria bacterium]